MFSSRQVAWISLIQFTPWTEEMILQTCIRSDSPRLRRNPSLLPWPPCEDKRNSDYLTSFIKQSHSKKKHSWKGHWNLLYIFIDIFLRGARWRITFYNMKQSILNFFAAIHFPLNSSYSSKTFLFLSPKPHRTPSLAGFPKYALTPQTCWLTNSPHPLFLLHN